RARVARPFPRVGRSILRATGGPDEWLLLPLSGREDRIRLTDLLRRTAPVDRFCKRPRYLEKFSLTAAREIATSGTRWGIVGCGGRRWLAVVEQTDGWDDASGSGGCSEGTSLIRWTTRDGWPSRPGSERRSPGSRKSASSPPNTECA